MKKLLQKRLKNEKGLTLVELLAVIVILGIIAAIAVPSIGSIIEKSRVNAAVADAQNALAAANLYFVENQDEPSVTLEELKDNKFLQDVGTLQDGIEITKSDEGNTISGTAQIKGGKTITFNDATNTSLSNKNGYTVSE
ncbi:type IV pilin protein [Sporosarcina cyprini]|uniref:type IV pilin protein n=1 Tax=Sporosarcina cyprini TaxID=2910523 RepID=UPI001EE0E4C8|nr:prepilin-type N-terminal cleavage/methylation domain-containing protein [Sporosarcina cyprini]MCG3089255.1 prepilin-type N-terminal cleavage/methylation domain-containing protein [Sporosarcina cyprini]